MILKAVDPGVRGFGWAQFEGRSLVAAGYAFVDQARDHRAHVLVIEVPQVDGRTRVARLKDFSALSFAAGRIEGMIGADEVRRVAPREWKGSTPKRVVQTRVRAALSTAELATLERCRRDVQPMLWHNALDAVGIGLWHLGRMG